MEILVDYNNIQERDRTRGVVFVTDRILSTIGGTRLRGYQRVTFRLYDGWYENNRLTRFAQRLSAEVQSNFPRTFRSNDGNNSIKIIVNVELAYSLRSEPTIHLWHTFRPRSLQRNVNCRPLVDAGCVAAPCPIGSATHFLRTRRCPDRSCPVTPEDLFIRNEQKLVDTMIAADLFSIHLDAVPEAALVTSDDDLLPAVRLLVMRGMKVFQIHTRSGRPTPGYYTNGMSPRYVELNL